MNKRIKNKKLAFFFWIHYFTNRSLFPKTDPQIRIWIQIKIKWILNTECFRVVQWSQQIATIKLLFKKILFPFADGMKLTIENIDTVDLKGIVKSKY